jgi:hypothetical protein
MKNTIKALFDKASARAMNHVNRDASTSLMLLAKMNIDRIKKYNSDQSLSAVGFKVFSQWDEDGIIQHLINHVAIKQKTFIEFGVENYSEANTRFLLMNDNWQGLVLDGSQQHIDQIQNDEIYWKHDLLAKQAFITCDNINANIQSGSFDPDLGLLSIDIDGNDYWIWEKINVINPRIVVCEYNSLFGLSPVSVPYSEGFFRTKAHYSNLYFGASLGALCFLAKQKGYSFVGSNSAGCNAFFVRNDVSKGLRSLSPEDGYVLSRFRESRDKDGKLTFLRGHDRQKEISQMPLTNVVTGQSLKVGDLY